MDRHSHPLVDHSHSLGETCPVCEQTVPNDRLAAVKAKHAEYEREVQVRYSKAAEEEQERLKKHLGEDKLQAIAKLQAEIVLREAAARDGERKATLVQVEAKMSEAAKATQAAEARAAELSRTLEANAAEVKAAKEEHKRLEGEKVQAIAKLQSEIGAREAAARDAERKATLIEIEAKMNEAAKATQAAEARAAELSKTLDAQAIDATAKINAAREEATHQVWASLQPQLAAAQTAAQVASAEKDAALTAKASAEAQILAMKEGQDKVVAERTQEMRDALEKSHQVAINAAEAKHFEEAQKVKTQLADVTRQLDNKTAQELGEGAEVDLFESLKAAFPCDEITRVVKGAPGADIRHKVVHNGQLCGLILYDSKNHKAWQNKFVTKLRDDMLNDKADHAILSTIAFPQGCRQLHVQDSIVLVNPARAVMVAEIIRQQVVRSHALRLSNEDREEKVVELYAFITSERFLGQLAKIQSSADALHELDMKEKTAHNLVWTKRGSIVNAVAKAEADLRVSIDAIVGTTESLDAALAEAHKADSLSAAT